jgi:hypothetical protein
MHAVKTRLQFRVVPIIVSKLVKTGFRVLQFIHSYKVAKFGPCQAEAQQLSSSPNSTAISNISIIFPTWPQTRESTTTVSVASAPLGGRRL